jgi:hypothetical protein
MGSVGPRHRRSRLTASWAQWSAGRSRDLARGAAKDCRSGPASATAPAAAVRQSSWAVRPVMGSVGPRHRRSPLPALRRIGQAGVGEILPTEPRKLAGGFGTGDGIGRRRPTEFVRPPRPGWTGQASRWAAWGGRGRAGQCRQPGPGSDGRASRARQDRAGQSRAGRFSAGAGFSLPLPLPRPADEPSHPNAIQRVFMHHGPVGPWCGNGPGRAGSRR